MIPVHQRKLGRKCVKTDSRTLKLERYSTSALPSPPPTCDWTHGITNFGMMLNSSLGDCTIAACGHSIQIWTSNTGSEVTVSDGVILSLYEQWDGYVPGNPNTDQGGVELDVLNNWKCGNINQHRISGFTSVNVKNLTEVKQAINLFGGVYIGISLPLTAQNQTVWDVVPNGGADAVAGSWGGHAVFCPAYNPNTITCITWGEKLSMTNAFFETYCDEVYAIISQDWFNKSGVDPIGLNLSQLEADLKEL